jgi:hypothetical protein
LESRTVDPIMENGAIAAPSLRAASSPARRSHAERHAVLDAAGRSFSTSTTSCMPSTNVELELG